ncbi:MAG: hypothetical protein ACOCQR_00115 [bacterium]
MINITIVYQEVISFLPINKLDKQLAKPKLKKSYSFSPEKNVIICTIEKNV